MVGVVMLLRAGRSWSGKVWSVQPVHGPGGLVGVSGCAQPSRCGTRLRGCLGDLWAQIPQVWWYLRAQTVAYKAPQS